MTNRVRFARAAAAVLVGLLLFPVSLFAQGTALTTTTLSTAVTDTSGRTVVVASATGITASAPQTWIFVDGELMQVTALNGTTLTVTRGAQGTRAGTHAANALVYIGAATAFTTVDQGGTCTAANNASLPVINIRSGTIWHCVATTSGTIWQGWGSIPFAETRPRTVVAGVAYTILPTDYLVVLSTISNAVITKSFTLPSHVGLAGKQIVIKDESGGISATTSIILVGTIDGTNSAVATVIQMKTAFQSVGLSAGSGGWFTLWCFGGSSSGLSGALQSCR